MVFLPTWKTNFSKMYLDLSLSIYERPSVFRATRTSTSHGAQNPHAMAIFVRPRKPTRTAYGARLLTGRTRCKSIPRKLGCTTSACTHTQTPPSLLLSPLTWCDCRMASLLTGRWAHSHQYVCWAWELICQIHRPLIGLISCCVFYGYWVHPNRTKTCILGFLLYDKFCLQRIAHQSFWTFCCL